MSIRTLDGVRYYYYYYYCFTVVCVQGTTRVSRYQKKHSPTHHPDHQPSFISFFHLLRSTASSLFNSRAWQSFCTTLGPTSSLLWSFAQPHSKSSLVYLLVQSPTFHTPYISLPHQCLLFATDAHTCFAVAPRLSSITIVSHNYLLGTLSFTLTSPSRILLDGSYRELKFDTYVDHDSQPRGWSWRRELL